MNSLKQMQHRHRVTGADFRTPKTGGLRFLAALLLMTTFLLLVAR
ncbi:MAG: hypothetical protein E7F77_04405 [Serratia marcescens]|nr:hypothetical protein [Serratia marcescens]MDU3648338.1 hypothetical protein [Serratia marcescens]